MHGLDLDLDCGPGRDLKTFTDAPGNRGWPAYGPNPGPNPQPNRAVRVLC